MFVKIIQIKNKESILQPGEFYCCKCNEYMDSDLRHSNISKHCASCHVKIVSARVIRADKPAEIVKVEVLNARAIRQRAADLMLEIEYKRINGNHLADYL